MESELVIVLALAFVLLAPLAWLAIRDCQRRRERRRAWGRYYQ